MTRLGRNSVRFKRHSKNFSQRGPFAQFRSNMTSPKVDIAESRDAIEVTAELPGVDEKDLDVTLANGMLR